METWIHPDIIFSSTKLVQMNVRPKKHTGADQKTNPIQKVKAAKDFVAHRKLKAVSW